MMLIACVLNRPKYVTAARLKIVFFPPYFNRSHSNYSWFKALIRVWRQFQFEVEEYHKCMD